MSGNINVSGCPESVSKRSLNRFGRLEIQPIKTNVIKAVVVLLLLLLLPVSPAFAAVDHGYNGGDNYAGVQWHLGIKSEIGPSSAGVEGFGLGNSQSPDYWVEVTIRNNGNITCDERHDFSDDALNYQGQWYWLCGQPAIITGPSDDSAYYKVPNVDEGWIGSPGHCGSTSALGLGYACDHYWYVNWSSPKAPLPPPPPPKPVIIPPGTISFNQAPYGGWQTGCHYPNTPNIATIQLTADHHDCGATCANTTSCNFFVKTTDGPHGTCYLKSLPGSTFAVPGDPNYYVCGYVDSPKR